MRRRILVAAVAGAVVLAPAPAAAQSDPCATAVTLVGLRQLDDARAAYLILRQREPSRECATAGLKRLDERQKDAANLVKLADAARKRGEQDLATDRYLQALDIDANAAGARAGLAANLQPVTPAPTPVKEDPSLSERAETKGDSLFDDLERYGTWLAGWLAWGAALVLAILLLVRLGRWLAVSDGLERTFRTRLSIADFDAADDAAAEGKDASLMLAACLRGTAERPRTTVDQHAKTSPTTDVLGGLTTALKGFGPGAVAATLLGLIRSLIPRTTITVQGRIVSAHDGVGLALSLVEGGGQVLRATVLKQRDYGPGYAVEGEKQEQAAGNRSSALERLTVGGAVWLQHMLVDLGHASEGAGWTSDDWQSDAFFEAALLARKDGPDSQRELYTAALDRDPSNRAAAFNIAVLEARAGAWQRAERRLEDVAAAELADTVGGERSVLWFQATYHQAVVALRDGVAEPAYRHVRALVEALAEAVPAAKPAPTSGERPMTGSRRERREVRALAAEARALLESKDLGQADTERAEAIRRRADRLLYTGPDAPAEADGRNAQLRRIEAPALALLAGVLLAGRREGANQEEWSSAWRVALAEALVEDLDDVELPASSVIALLERPPAAAPDLRIWRGVRSDYNLACYHAQLAERLKAKEQRDKAVRNSLAWLAAAVNVKSLRAWAEHDPSFGWLRQHRPAEFWKVVGERAYAGELASLNPIGATLAAALAEQFDVTTPVSLVTHVQRNGAPHLARDLAIPESLVHRWVGLAQLCAIAGVTIELANLLDDADVQTPRQLAAATADELHALLVNAAKASSDEVDVPQPYQLERWIAAAKAIDAVRPVADA